MNQATNYLGHSVNIQKGHVTLQNEKLSLRKVLIKKEQLQNEQYKKEFEVIDSYIDNIINPERKYRSQQ